jgi:hypothetical protein
VILPWNPGPYQLVSMYSDVVMSVFIKKAPACEARALVGLVG